MLRQFCYHLSQSLLALRPLIKSKEKSLFERLIPPRLRMDVIPSRLLLLCPNADLSCSGPCASERRRTSDCRCLYSELCAKIRSRFVAVQVRICREKPARGSGTLTVVAPVQSEPLRSVEETSLHCVTLLRNGVGCRLTLSPNAGHLAALPS